jgi:hypothetical protein
VSAAARVGAAAPLSTTEPPTNPKKPVWMDPTHLPLIRRVLAQVESALAASGRCRALLPPPHGTERPGSADDSGGGACEAAADDEAAARTLPPTAPPRQVSRAFPSWNRSILTEIYLCHACSYHEFAGQPVGEHGGGAAAGWGARRSRTA